MSNTAKQIEEDSIDFQIGKEIAEMLRLERNELGRFMTIWGDKTEIGLARTIKRIMNREN